MHRMLYSLEDYFEDRALDGVPWWAARLLRSLSRTLGEAGDIIAFR